MLTMVCLGTPLMVADLIGLIHMVTDAYLLSKYSQYVLSVLGQPFPMLFYPRIFFKGYLSNELALVSQYIGAKLYDKASIVLSKMFTLCLSTSIAIAMFSKSLNTILLLLLDLPTEILHEVLNYVGIMGLDLVVFGIGMAMGTVFQAIDDTKTPTITISIGELTNAVLHPIFIVGLGSLLAMGVRGIAIVAVILRSLGTGLSVLHHEDKMPKYQD